MKVVVVAATLLVITVVLDPEGFLRCFIHSISDFNGE
jgi:hypothetical protein